MSSLSLALLTLPAAPSRTVGPATPGSPASSASPASAWNAGHQMPDSPGQPARKMLPPPRIISEIPIQKQGAGQMLGPPLLSLKDYVSCTDMHVSAPPSPFSPLAQDHPAALPPCPSPPNPNPNPHCKYLLSASLLCLLLQKERGAQLGGGRSQPRAPPHAHSSPFPGSKYLALSTARHASSSRPTLHLSCGTDARAPVGLPGDLVPPGIGSWSLVFQLPSRPFA